MRAVKKVQIFLFICFLIFGVGLFFVSKGLEAQKNYRRPMTKKLESTLKVRLIKNFVGIRENNLFFKVEGKAWSENLIENVHYYWRSTEQQNSLKEGVISQIGRDEIAIEGFEVSVPRGNEKLIHLLLVTENGIGASVTVKLKDEDLLASKEELKNSLTNNTSHIIDANDVNVNNIRKTNPINRTKKEIFRLNKKNSKKIKLH